MAEETDKVILVPRHTTLVGGTYHTAPLRVTEYDRAHLIAWRGVETGTNLASFVVRLQESEDLEEWSQVGSDIAPLAGGSEVTAERALRTEWIRLEIVVQRDGMEELSPAVTCWVVGNFVRRAAGGGGGAR